MSEEQEKERMFTFVRRTGSRTEDMEEIQVPESELTYEQTAMLAAELWKAFLSVSGPAQDMFLARIDAEIQENKAIIEHAEAAESGKIIGLDGNFLTLGQA